MMRNVLVGYDGSESAGKALEFAIDLAKLSGARLHLLAVVRPPDFAEDVETEAMIESLQRQLRHSVAIALSKARDAGVETASSLVVGHPAEQLVRYAEAHEIDHIVVGHRGHSLFERWLIGSVARQVIAYAPCAVTVVRTRAG
jgi:nucleotide-binding universal stress UspA family protein